MSTMALKKVTLDQMEKNKIYLYGEHISRKGDNALWYDWYVIRKDGEGLVRDKDGDNFPIDKKEAADIYELPDGVVPDRLPSQITKNRGDL